MKIELVAELIHTESVAKVLGTNPSRAYEGESDSRLGYERTRWEDFSGC